MSNRSSHSAIYRSPWLRVSLSSGAIFIAAKAVTFARIPIRQIYVAPQQSSFSNRKNCLDVILFQWQRLGMNRKHPLKAWLEKAPINRTKFAESVDCSLPHLTLVSQGKRGVSLGLALNIERETAGAVTAEQLLKARQDAQ